MHLLFRCFRARDGSPENPHEEKTKRQRGTARKHIEQKTRIIFLCNRHSNIHGEKMKARQVVRGFWQQKTFPYRHYSDHTLHFFSLFELDFFFPFLKLAPPRCDDTTETELFFSE
jgi:hypothetical protein